MKYTYILFIIFLLTIFSNAIAQVKGGDKLGDVKATFDSDKGILSAAPGVELMIGGEYQKGTIQVDGLSKDTPQVMKAEEGFAYRVIYQTDQPMMETVVDSLGVETQQPSTYFLEDVLDGNILELYDDHFAITDFNGKYHTYWANYRWGVIKDKEARHSPRVVYLKADGNDITGLGSLAAPWRTLAKINRLTTASIAGGDTVKLYGGDEFGANQLKEDGVTRSDTCLVVPTSGAADSAVVYTSYGAGRATITGARRIQGWANISGNIYGRAKANPDSSFAMYKGTVGVNDSLMTRVVTRATLDAHKEWFTTPDSTYVFLLAAADTTYLYRSKNYAINGNSKNYVTFVNLRVTKGTGVNPAVGDAVAFLISGTNNIISKALVDSCDNGVSATKAVTINSSVFTGLKTYGIKLRYDGSEIYNTTINGGVTGIYSSSGIDGYTLKNNIIYSPSSYFINSSSTGVNTISNNLYYSTSYTNKWYYAGAIATLADWMTASGETNALQGWPKFLGQADSTSAITDYHLQPSSKAVNAGVDVGLTTDYDGNPVPSGGGYDIGALELQISPPTIVTNGSTTLGTNGITLNGIITSLGNSLNVDSVKVRYKLGATPTSDTDSCTVAVGSNITSVPSTFSLTVPNRIINQPYYFQLMGKNNGGWGYSNTDRFISNKQYIQMFPY